VGGQIVKRLLSSGVILAALAGGAPSFAADLALPVVAPVYLWTGCYAGIHGGYGLMADQWSGVRGDGGIAGGQAGCNYQTGHLVLGIEGEGWWSGLRAANTYDGFAPTLYTETDTTKNRWDFDLALRAGYARGPALFYGKAGVAVGRFDFSTTSFQSPNFYWADTAVTSAGFILGVGLEYAFAAHWTAKLEYDFVDYPGRSLTYTQFDNFNFPYTYSATITTWKQIVKVGANYRF
jgi:outer membrane immunogenic protein